MNKHKVPQAYWKSGDSARKTEEYPSYKGPWRLSFIIFNLFIFIMILLGLNQTRDFNEATDLRNSGFLDPE